MHQIYDKETKLFTGTGYVTLTNEILEHHTKRKEGILNTSSNIIVSMKKDDVVYREITLDELREVKKEDIRRESEIANQADMDYLGTTFQADERSQQRIVAVLGTGTLPTGFYWLDKLNNQVPMTYLELQGLSAAILNRNQINFTQYQLLKIDIYKDSLTTSEELDSIIWSLT